MKLSNEKLSNIPSPNNAVMMDMNKIRNVSAIIIGSRQNLKTKP